VAVYVDELFTMQSKNAQAFRVGTRTGHKWCHMFAWPDDAELHVLAQRIGLKPEWVDRSRDGTIHYDLTPKKRAAAIRAGAALGRGSRGDLGHAARPTTKGQQMTTTYDNDPNHGPHMFLLLVLLLLVSFALLFTACYPEPTRDNACYTPPGLVTNTLPEPDGGDGACESFAQVASTCAEAAALALNVSVDFYPDPYTVGLHPDTDGGAWPPDVYERRCRVHGDLRADVVHRSRDPARLVRLVVAARA
jgi:hypothetical protein